jgi:hypothetical protein
MWVDDKLKGDRLRLFDGTQTKQKTPDAVPILKYRRLRL